ncbi:MAG TPA: type II toxin-antitoxin system RelE/ParE family toxin [Candidatus Lokiarchaeia archaeon]|nr:type II toxin-antitoxin system RelE/ParE family toxin [Candidatus Lokiarchaeia archaeon]
MNQIAFLPDAEEEMNAAARFYDLQVDGLGEDFLSELQFALQSIQKFPYRWSIFEEDFRKYRLKKFPYNIFYSVSEDQIIIIAVAHQKRKPDYWKNRIVYS